MDNLIGSKPKGAAKQQGLAIKDQLEAFNEGDGVAAEPSTRSVRLVMPRGDWGSE